MNIKLPVRRITALALLSVALLTTAHAATTTATVSFTSGDMTVTDPYSTGAAATTQYNVLVATPGLPQFNADTGVLTGATVNVTSSRTQTLSGSASKAGSTGSMTANFIGNSTANITAPGVNNTFGSINLATSCSMNGSTAKNCTPSSQNQAVTTNATALGVTNGNLNSYVGTSTVLGTTLTLPQLQSNLTDTNTTYDLNGGSSIYTLNWSGSIDVTYSYLLHAAPSFDGGSLMELNLDLGSWVQGSVATPVGFSLFNAAGDRTGLDLMGIVLENGATVFSIDPVVSSITAGSSADFNAMLNTSTVGNYSASYRLSLSDFLPLGAASDTQHTYTMQLNLTGIVTAVPLPPTVLLFGSGMLGIIVIARHKKA